MKKSSLLFSLCWFTLIACSQKETSHTQARPAIGGPCDNCEIIHDYGDKILSSIDTLPGFQNGKKKILLTGTIFQQDGKTPAENIILYIYHTNEEGTYEMVAHPKQAGTELVLHRGWIKTDHTGRYSFYTFLPAAYPNGREAQHVHPLILEPQKNVYYIDEFVFDDDPLLTQTKREACTNRGGSGIIQLKNQGPLWLGQRDIILGQNIPNYF